MKKFIFKIALLCLTTSLVVTSCSQDGDLETATRTNFTTKSISSTSPFANTNFEDYGAYHNIILDKIYDRYNEVNMSTTTQSELYTMAQEETYSYLTTSGYFTNPSDSLIQLTPNMSSTTLDDFVDDLEVDAVPYLTSQFSQDKYDEVNAILDNYATVENYTSTDAIADLRDVETDITSTTTNLGDVEYVAIRSMVVTAIYSMRYWETNFDKWARLNPNYVAGRGRGWGWFKGTLQKMVKSDMYGFMIGGAVGATAGLITTGGVASGPMALETGLTFACNGSAVAGIRALLND